MTRRLLFLTLPLVALTAGLPAAQAATFQYRQYVPGVAQSAAPSAPAAQPLTLSLMPGSLPSALRGTPYSYDFTALLAASGGGLSNPSQVTWSSTGALPSGLSLGTTGLLAGTPDVLGSSAFQVTASYPGTASPSQTYTITVNGQPLDVTQVALGNVFSCALTAAGGLKCWGDNTYGQLGDGTTVDHYTPKDVLGLTTGVAQVVAGSTRACALTTAGAVYCWGYNNGRLGDGTTVARHSPTAVTGLSSGVSRLAMSSTGEHTCALTTGGGVKCWGLNSGGQVGDGTTTLRGVPTDVTGLSSGVAAISAGGDTSCALTTAGALLCWGMNNNNQLGDGTTTARTTPNQVSGLSSGVAQISSGDLHMCAVLTSGAAYCWGYNGNGRLGDGTTVNRATPTAINGLSSGVAQIQAGGYSSCARMSSGGVKCWGYNNYGNLGNGTTTVSYLPVDTLSITDAAQISVGTHHACASSTSGTLRCWGFNASGRLGDGTTVNKTSPVVIQP